MAKGFRRMVSAVTVISCVVAALHGRHSEARFTELVARATPPVTPIKVTRGFDPPTSAYGPGHRGVDLAASPGAPVFSALSGIVIFAGAVAGSDVVSVQSAPEQRLTYEPIKAVVTQGAFVTQGQLLGHLEPGHLGCPVTACLHWGLIIGSVYADPLSLLAADQVRLLPWNGSPYPKLGDS